MRLRLSYFCPNTPTIPFSSSSYHTKSFFTYALYTDNKISCNGCVIRQRAKRICKHILRCKRKRIQQIFDCFESIQVVFSHLPCCRKLVLGWFKCPNASLHVYPNPTKNVESTVKFHPRWFFMRCHSWNRK